MHVQYKNRLEKMAMLEIKAFIPNNRIYQNDKINVSNSLKPMTPVIIVQHMTLINTYWLAAF